MGRTRRFGIREMPVDPCLSPIPHRLSMLSPDSSVDLCAFVSYLRAQPCVFLEDFVMARWPTAHCSCRPRLSALLALALLAAMSRVPPKLVTMTNMPSARVGLAYSLANLSEDERPRMAGIVLM